MKIAVLMSTYNGHRYLNEQLESLAKQTVAEDMTVYIRDDGSTDDTFEIIDRWKDRIDISLIKGKNVGPAQSFWTLFVDKDIKADYYAFCDQDDIWDKDKIERGLNAIMAEGGPALWCSNCRIIGSTDSLLKERMLEELPNLSICSQLVCGLIQGCAMLFNNELRKYILTKKTEHVPMHDIVVMTYCLAVGTVIYDKLPSFSYRMHENNVVAKEKKSLLKRIIHSYKMWFFPKKKNETSVFAKVLLEDNKQFLDESTANYLNNVANSKENFWLRLKVIFDPLTNSINKSAELSYKIRLFIGVL